MARTSDDPEKIVEVWTATLERFGEAPVFREVRDVMDQLAPPRAYHRQTDAGSSERDDEEPREPEGDEAAFARWLKSTDRALGEAEDLANSALSTAYVGQATKWLAEVDALHVRLRSIRAVIVHRAKADEHRIRRRRARKAQA